MQFSKHNIISNIKSSDSYYIINPLSKNADLLSKEQYESIFNNSYEDKNELIEKGYLVNPEEEEKLFKTEYLQFIDDRDSDEIQIFFVPWYTCNFNCFYCFQDEYTNPQHTVEKTVVDAFFNYLDTAFSGRKKYITIFGGEPFLKGQKQIDTIEYFVNECNKRSLDIAVVTNGYYIDAYLPILKNASIREIQVTLDGMKEIHDKRRPLKGGGGTFDLIVKNIDSLLENNIPINLRMVVDKDNVDDLPKLAQFAIDKGWTKSELFKTQLGRNYELHHCQTENQRLYTRLDMYEDIFTLLKEFPHIIEFHKPAFSIAKFIFENGELPTPLFDSCPGTKTEWAFDYTGSIYSCTATVGNEGDRLGTFYPEVQLNEEEVFEWEDRDVVSIEACNSCNVRLACGGGCASVAKNRTGKIHETDCRPIKELLSLGIGYYFKPEEEAK